MQTPAQKRATEKWREKNKESIALKSKIWREKNKDRLKQKTKEWIQNNPERHKKNMRRYFSIKKNKEKLYNAVRKNALKNRYNLTESDYEQMLKEQNGVCAICGREPQKRKLAVDHCHKSNKIRGLLCVTCNLGVGYLKDDVSLLKMAIAYLQKYNQTFPQL